MIRMGAWQRGQQWTAIGAVFAVVDGGPRAPTNLRHRGNNTQLRGR
jgi:hypothetical protein